MIAMPRLPLVRLALAALALVLSGCAARQSTESFFGFITPYRIDIMQGNVVTAELAAMVMPGMSKEQVRDILGSPLLTSPFHAERWDYVFTLRRQGVEPQRRSVVAWFKDNKLDRLEAAIEQAADGPGTAAGTAAGTDAGTAA